MAEVARSDVCNQNAGLIRGRLKHHHGPEKGSRRQEVRVFSDKKRNLQSWVETHNVGRAEIKMSY